MKSWCCFSKVEREKEMPAFKNKSSIKSTTLKKLKSNDLYYRVEELKEDSLEIAPISLQSLSNEEEVEDHPESKKIIHSFGQVAVRNDQGSRPHDEKTANANIPILSNENCWKIGPSLLGVQEQQAQPASTKDNAFISSQVIEAPESSMSSSMHFGELKSNSDVSDTIKTPSFNPAPSQNSIGVVVSSQLGAQGSFEGSQKLRRNK